MGLTHRQKKQKARQERLRHRGTQEGFRPPTDKELRTGKLGMWILIGVLAVAFAVLVYAIR